MFNVVLITIDSLRADHVGSIASTNRGDTLTPCLDEWSKEAFVFSSAVSQSSHTSPSFLAILSGCYPCRYGDWFSIMSTDRVAIAEILKQNGYHTGAIISNPYISKAFCFNRGFDYFEDNVARMRESGFGRKIDLASFRLKTAFREPYAPAEVINKQVFAWKQKCLTPFFLWAHYMDVHGPYIHKKGFTNRIASGQLWHKALVKPQKITARQRAALLRAYKEKVKFIDHQVYSLLSEIDSPDTMVIILADHGDLFDEHGLFGHQLRLYEGLLHVPMLIKLPKIIEAERTRVRRAVRTMDITPTILDVVGIDPPEPLDGESLLPLMKGNEDAYLCQHIISEVSRSHLCVKMFPWKLIVDYCQDSKELYNLEDDPAERKNLASREATILHSLEGKLLEHITKFKQTDTSSSGAQFDEEVKTQLKALGYFD